MCLEINSHLSSHFYFFLTYRIRLFTGFAHVLTQSTRKSVNLPGLIILHTELCWVPAAQSLVFMLCLVLLFVCLSFRLKRWRCHFILDLLLWMSLCHLTLFVNGISLYISIVNRIKNNEVYKLLRDVLNSCITMVLCCVSMSCDTIWFF